MSAADRNKRFLPFCKPRCQKAPSPKSCCMKAFQVLHLVFCTVPFLCLTFTSRLLCPLCAIEQLSIDMGCVTWKTKLHVRYINYITYKKHKALESHGLGSDSMTRLEHLDAIQRDLQGHDVQIASFGVN